MLASTDGDTDLNEKALAALTMTDNSQQNAHMLPPKLRAKYMFHKAKCVQLQRSGCLVVCISCF
jgi:hypothetical protein